MKGYRCIKAIYLNVRKPELEAPISEEQQALFDQGNAVGAEARKRFPGGVLIDNKPWDFFGSLKATRDLLSSGTDVIYEAAFEYRGCYARADIICFSPTSKRWSIFEVKSSTKIKPEQIDDIGLQAWIIANAGLPIEKINILHLNPDCHYPDLSDLFKVVDVTDRLREKYPSIAPKVTEILSVLESGQPPLIDIGSHCFDPNECGFREACWSEKKIPQISVLDLPNIRDKKWELYAQGKIALNEAPLAELNDLQQRAATVHLTGKRFIDSKGISDAMATWKFPLIFLDFETINPAIPRYDGCGPYDHVPFQFSVHVWKDRDSVIEHREFLHCESSDPRPTLIPELVAACGGDGSVVSYYGRFESDRIKEMANQFPKHKDRLELLIGRIVDPLPIIREHVYDAGFKGSFGLKAVAPALLGGSFSYEGMAVPDGTAAQRAFEEMIRCADSKRKEELRQGMLEYCQKDTLVMVELVKWLFANSKS